MKRDLIHEVFSQLQKGKYIRLAWEDEKENFSKKAYDNYDKFIAKVNELRSNPHVASIWFTPHPSNSETSHENDNVKHVQWVYVDIDDISTEDFIKNYNFIRPTYIIATGHGVQLYWKLKQRLAEPFDEWRTVEKAIEKKFNGEKGYACALLRVPDTPNRKHLIEKHRKKGYSVETECKVIEFNDVAYDLDDFILAGLKSNAKPAPTIQNNETKLTISDLTRIRQHCPAVDSAFKSIENDSDNNKTAGHNKRLTVASMIKHTVDDEDYVLKLFSNTTDFKKDVTLKNYRSVKQKPITCRQLQEWNLCSKPCQLIQDLNKKSPIVFAYRSGVQLELTNELLNNAEDDVNFEELAKRVKSLENPVNQSKLINRIQATTALSKDDIKRYLRKIKVRDDLNSYIINGEIDYVKAAEFIIKMHKIMRHQQDFYQYREGIWDRMPKEEAESLIHHEIKKYSDNHTISEVINAVKRESLITPTQVEKAQDKFVIAASNGLLDIRDNTLRDFKQTDYRFKKMAAAYNPDADWPKFKEFINELFLFDKDAADKRLLVQEIFGYLLIPDYTLIKKMFYFYGLKADNGKSSLINIIRSVMGRGYFDSVPMEKLDGFLLKRLSGIHANIVGDQNAFTRVPDGIIKQLIGGMDEITADVKNKEAIILNNFARLIFAVNKLPYSEAKDEGYFTRAVILTFNNQFLINPDKKDPRQMKADTEKIQYITDNEKDGILNWMLEGLKRLLTNKRLTIPKSSETALEDYKTSNNSILLFVKEECELDPLYRTGRSELYTSYKDWCFRQGFKHNANAHTFYDMLQREFNIVQRRTKQSRQLEGIR